MTYQHNPHHVLDFDFNGEILFILYMPTMLQIYIGGIFVYIKIIMQFAIIESKFQHLGWMH